MRTTAPRPHRRVCTIATATLLTVGMGVFGSSAAFADTLPVDTSASTTSSATPTDTATTTDDAAGSTDAAAAPEEWPADQAATPAGTSNTSATPGASASASATPTAEATVTPAVATTSGTVRVSGTAGVGSTLTTSTDLWPAGTTFTYQWLRGTTPIDGASAATYTLTSADVNSAVALQVVGTAPGADPSAPVTSDPTVVVGIAPSYAQEVVEVDLVAGEAYSNFFDAGGTPTPRYQLFRADPNREPDLPAGMTFSNGTISGTPTEAGYFPVQVAADSTAGQDQIEVDIVVQPAEAVGVGTFVITNGDYDGANVFQSDGTQSAVQTALDGQKLTLVPYLFDQYGNAGATNDADGPVTISSSIAADEVSLGTEDADPSVTVSGAGTHVITVTEGGFSVSVRVTVAARAAVVPAGTITTATQPTSRATLAYTGSDDAGLLAWALGLIAAGAAMTVLRFRRRRTQR